MGIILKILSFVSKNYKALYIVYQSLELLYKYLKKTDIMEGLLSKKAEKGFGKFIDSKLKLPIWAEPFDGFLATQSIRLLDEKLHSKVPEKFTIVFTKLNGVFEVYEDTDNLDFKGLVTVEELTEVINTLIDVPNMTEDEEAVILSGLLTGIFQVIKIYVNKQE